MRYFLLLSYKGGAYHGWQVQKNAHSVQAEIETALETILREKIEVVGCGRTDTGVHAHRYFLHFDTEQMVDKNLVYQLNSILPKDIGFYHLFKVPDSLHARFDAEVRTYRYFIHFVKNPFLHDRSYYFRQQKQLDIVLMNEFCRHLLSVNDFTSFEKKGSDNTNSICKVTKAEWSHTEDGLQFEIQSNRFLRNMVRAIVGTSLMIGCKRRNLKEILSEIENKEIIQLSMTAPACGLHLWDVKYLNLKI
ncbi:MAG: tRNA pseudouridine(38-40) synthase TruA [Chitinophagales bacterium]|nr:tRNA pseudouridine(38-40) synthase TruA [Chitinophagales bacterium]